MQALPVKSASLPTSSPSSLLCKTVPKRQCISHKRLLGGIWSTPVPVVVPRTRGLRARATHVSGQQPVRLKYSEAQGYKQDVNVSGAAHGVQKVRALIIDNYDSYTYNLFQLTAVIYGITPVVVRNDQWIWEELQPLLTGPTRAFDCVILSPGPGTPERPSDVGVCEAILRNCTDLPVLGVCLGHQLLGSVHGASVVHAPEPVHGRLSSVEHANHPLFAKIPSGTWQVVRYHSLVVEPATVPPDLEATAWSSGRDVIMGLSHRIYPHHGVQFHPESIATEHGDTLLKNFKALTIAHWNSNLVSLPGTLSLEQPLWTTPAADIDNQSKAKPFSKRTLLEADIPSKKAGKQEGGVVSPSAWGVQVYWHRLPGVVDKLGGSEAIFQKLFGESDAEDTFWLDSALTTMGRARFSFMGGKGGPLWRRVLYWLSEDEGNRVKVEASDGSVLLDTAQGVVSIFDFLEKELALKSCLPADVADLPFDFCGGFVGYLGYELKAECGACGKPHKAPTPDAAFFFADQIIAIDHNTNDLYALALYEAPPTGPVKPVNGKAPGPFTPVNHEAPANGKAKLDDRALGTSNSANDSLADNGNPMVDSRASAQEWVAESLRTALELLASPSGLAVEVPSGGGQMWEFECVRSKAEYLADVDKCLEAIRDGESYEVCLTTQLRCPAPWLDPLTLYSSLRQVNPAPYAAWLSFGGVRGGLAICCSSPERFLRLDRRGILEAKPIKGTVARGASPEEDEELKEALRSSEKDRAENLMITDLLRNDLGKICEEGTVCVPTLMAIESYATVHQLVTTVRGLKRASVGSVECARAAFPGGSMTGAPKIRTMEIIDKVEKAARGVYSGAIGYFSVSNTFDLNIVIRSVVVHDGVLSIGAGGAVVALSHRESEYEEMLLKTRALRKALEQAGQGESSCVSALEKCR